MQTIRNAVSGALEGLGPRVVDAVFERVPGVVSNGLVRIEVKGSWDDINPRTKALMPYRGREVTLYREGLIGRENLGTVTLDEQGCGEFIVPESSSWFKQQDDYTLNLTNEPHPHARQGLSPWGKGRSRVVDQIVRFNLGKNVAEAHGSFTAIYAPHPKDIKEILPSPVSQRPSFPYFKAMFDATIGVIFVAVVVDKAKNYLTSTQIQWMYDTFTKKHPKIDLTPENLISWLLNGILRGGKVTRDGSHVIWEVNYDKSIVNRSDWPVSVEVHGDLDKDLKGKVQLEKIVIRLLDDSELTVGIADKNLQAAIAVAMSTFGFKGQAGERGHLPEGHLIPGNLAIPFFKYISPNNPIYPVVACFLREVGFINNISGKKIIFGEGSGLASAGVPFWECDKMLVEATKVLSNWKTYTLEEEIGDEDYFTRCENYAYKKLHAFYVTFLFENREAITPFWSEIRDWSDITRDHLERFPLVTENASDPTDQDLQDLSRMLAWLAVKLVKHYFQHTGQTPFTDIHTLSLAMRNLSLDDSGDFVKDLNTPVHDANLQNLITRSLLNAELPTILENKYGDIPASVYAVLVDIVHFAMKNGYPDANKMTCVTNI